MALVSEHKVSELVGVAITSVNTTLQNYEGVTFEWDNDKQVSAYNTPGFDVFNNDNCSY